MWKLFKIHLNLFRAKRHPSSQNWNTLSINGTIYGIYLWCTWRGKNIVSRSEPSSSSSSYVVALIYRMKCVEIVLNGLTEVNHILSDFEIKLASYGEMPSEVEALKMVQKELTNLQNNVSINQHNIDQVMEDGHNARRLVEKSRHHFHSSVHHDLDRLDSDLNKVTVRWNNICSQLVDR